MIVFPPEELKRLADLCEKAYPREACGLIVGSQEGQGTWYVERIEPSANLAEQPEHRFEIDTVLRLALQRGLRAGARSVVGVYHSHPDGSAQPSKTDLEQAWEQDLVWVICAVAAGQACHFTAHVLADQATRFREIPLRTTQWGAYPVRQPPGE